MTRPRAGFPLTLESGADGLRKRSWIKISQIRTLAAERIGRSIARASEDELSRIIEGLNEILGHSAPRMPCQFPGVFSLAYASGADLCSAKRRDRFSASLWRTLLILPAQTCSHHGSKLSFAMRIISKRTLRQFWETHPRGAEARTPLQVWHSTVKVADWANPADVKQTFGNASILKSGRVVFNISGNKFRLVVRINYAYRVVYVRFVGTHQEYDHIDVETV